METPGRSYIGGREAFEGSEWEETEERIKKRRRGLRIEEVFLRRVDLGLRTSAGFSTVCFSH
jgi:hypothetical protein